MQLADDNGDEADGKDEALVPLGAGLLRDDFLKAHVVDKVPHGVHLTAFTDSCHSGTALDLPYHYRLLEPRMMRARVPRPPGSVVHWAGCRDGELSFEGNVNGIFTRAFCDILYETRDIALQEKRKFEITYEEMGNELITRMWGQLPAYSSTAHLSVHDAVEL
jgi:hypothetical protein